MGMPETVRRWTREGGLDLPDDGNRYELINGELLVTPAPRWIHQLAVLALYRRIYPYVAHRVVEHWRPADERPAILEGSLEWRPPGLLEPLTIDPPACFAEVWGEEE
jgi:Uma2 family endonuclease